MKPNHVNKILCSQSRKVSLIMDHTVINRNGPDHSRTFPDQFFAERLCVSMRGKIHNSLSSHVHCCHYLFHFNVIILTVSGNSKIHIDLCTQHGAYSIWLNAGVKSVGADSHLAFCNKLSDFFLCAVLFCCNLFHFRSDNPTSCSLHLCFIFSHKAFPFRVFIFVILILFIYIYFLFYRFAI